MLLVACPISGGGRAFSAIPAVFERPTQSEKAQDTRAELPPRDFHHPDGGSRHRLLGYQIVLLTLLGGLAAGAAGFFGGPLVLDGRGLGRFGGLLVVGAGLTLCAAIWGWTIYGSGWGLFRALVPFGHALFG
jgi:hypothetical protein